MRTAILTALIVLALVIFWGLGRAMAQTDSGWGVSMIVCSMCARGDGHTVVVPFDSYERCDNAKQGMEISNRLAWIVCLNGPEAEIVAATARGFAAHCQEVMRRPNQRPDDGFPQSFDECMARLGGQQ